MSCLVLGLALSMAQTPCMGICALCESLSSGWRDETGSCLQGSGEGQVQLKITYFPFELLYSKPRDASLVGHPPPIYTPDWVPVVHTRGLAK